jgi:poly(3-hydroxybutyrate) depolymerase
MACLPVQAISADSFENADPVPHDPSNGSGGATGSVSGTVTVAQPKFANEVYYLHVPSNYTPTRSWPLVLALHGAAGSHSAAVTAAEAVRTAWSALADRYGFIVLVPVGEGLQGSWIAPSEVGGFPSDYDVFVAAIAAVEASYNVERSRLYGWGYSSGGHVMHDIAVRGFAPAIDANHMAAYGVNGGILAELACLNVSSATCATRLAAMPRKVPLDIHIGSSDTTVAPSYARSDHALFLAQGWVDEETIFYREFDGGHIYTTAQLGEIWQHLCRYALAP